MPVSQVEDLQRGYRGTKKTIDKMHRLVAAGKLDPEMQRIASWIRMRVQNDQRGRSRQLAEAVYNWVRRHGVFQRDPLQIEKLETPAEAMRPVVEARQGGAYQGRGLFIGDCDTYAIMVATLGGILGYEYAFETVKIDPRRPKEFSHIYTALLVDGQWLPLDASTTLGGPGWRPTVPAKKLQRWREPLIEKTMKKRPLNGKRKAAGMGDWVPPKPGYLPYDYQGYGIPKNFPGRPEVSRVNPGVWDVEIPIEPAKPRGMMHEDLFYTQRYPTPPPNSRLPMDEKNYMAVPQYMPKRPYISRSTPYPFGWPYSEQEVLVMDQPFLKDPSAGTGYDVVQPEIIPIAGYEGLGQEEVKEYPLAGVIDKTKLTAAKTALEAKGILGTYTAKNGTVEVRVPTEKLDIAKPIVATFAAETKATTSIAGSIEKALTGLIESVPTMTQAYYDRKRLEMQARVEEAAARTAESQRAAIEAGRPSFFTAKAWYTDPLVLGGIAVAVVGGYFLILKPMMAPKRRRNPARGRRRSYRMRSRRRAA